MAYAKISCAGPYMYKLLQNEGSLIFQIHLLLNHTSIDILLVFGCSDHFDLLNVGTTFKRTEFLSNRHNVTTMLTRSSNDTLLWRWPDVFHVYDDQIKFYWFPIAAKQN